MKLRIDGEDIDWRDLRFDSMKEHDMPKPVGRVLEETEDESGFMVRYELYKDDDPDDRPTNTCGAKTAFEAAAVIWLTMVAIVATLVLRGK